MSQQPHDWVRSTLGHGDAMCSRCSITNREAVILGEHTCEAPSPANNAPEPEPGSVWRHHSGRIYTVLFLVNEPDSAKPEYPRTVVYVGANGKMWAGRLDDWHRRMTEIPKEQSNV